jgi:hypothetical protein
MTDSTNTAQVPVEALQELQRQLEEANAKIAASEQGRVDAEQGRADAEGKAALAEDRAKAEAEKSALSDEQIAAQKAVIAALEKKKAEAEERAERASPDANLSRSSSKERFRIMIYESREKSDSKEVPVSVNGRAYQIKRGVQVDVPQEVVSVLSDAVIGQGVPIVDERTGIEAGVEYINAARFPFQMLGKSVDAEGNFLAGFEPS